MYNLNLVSYMYFAGQFCWQMAFWLAPWPDGLRGVLRDFSHKFERVLTYVEILHMMQMLMGCFQFCCDGVVKEIICVSCFCAGMSLLSVVVVILCWLFCQLLLLCCWDVPHKFCSV